MIRYQKGFYFIIHIEIAKNIFSLLLFFRFQKNPLLRSKSFTNYDINKQSNKKFYSTPTQAISLCPNNKSPLIFIRRLLYKRDRGLPKRFIFLTSISYWSIKNPTVVNLIRMGNTTNSVTVLIQYTTSVKYNNLIAASLNIKISNIHNFY